MWNSICMHKKIISAYKNSTNQTFTYISSKQVNFKKQLACKVQHPEEMKFPLPLNVPCCSHTIRLMERAMVESLHNQLKDDFRNLLFGCA